GQARAQALEPGQALLARAGDHEGRPARVLPRRRAGARPPPEGPPVHHEALSGRVAGRSLLPEGRPEAHARVDPDRDVPLDIARVTGEADDQLPARERRARAALD